MEKRYTIQIKYQDQTKKPYTADFQTKPEFAKGWKSVLETAHAGADITCMCFGRGDKKLSVRHLGGADSYCLARYPNSGPQHANDCIYYAPDPSKSGLQGYAEGVVTEIEDGGLRAKSSISAMVCYILANIEKPLSIKNITDALTAGCIANYFEICDSIDRLKAAGQIVEKDDRLYATPQCKAAVELIENDLPLTMREKSIACCQRALAKETYQRENRVDIEPDGNAFQVTLHVSDIDRDFMALKLYMPTKAQAQAVKEKFQANPVRVYEAVINTLFSEEQDPPID